MICAVLNPAARSADALLAGDVDGSVSAVLSGVPLVGGSLADQLDTSSATESVKGSVGEQLGSLTETSLSPAELQVLYDQYESEAASGHITTQTKFNYAWALIKSPQRQQMLQGVALLTGTYLLFRWRWSWLPSLST